MSDSGKAVFLSYASQDKEAAKRICDALQAAGLEVWFDQSELRGGDSWDAMIRKRIKDCALFVPLITPTTNARAEGYFRLEWKLAVDRSHLMADDAPFLFPVVLGDVKDATARVPDKFREVQWTRLRLDETPAELAGRVARLLSKEQGAGSTEHGTRAREERSRRGERPPWVRNLSIVVGLAIGLIYAIRPLLLTEKSPRVKPAEVAPVTIAPVSEARKLADRARAMSLTNYNSTIDDFIAAEGLVKRALDLDSNDGEIWAVSSLLNFSFNSRGFDRSPARNAAARAHAERALKLAPDSIEALFALGRWQRDYDAPVVAEATFLKVLARDPDHSGALHSLGYLYDRLDRIDEAAALYAREAKNPATAPLAAYTEFLMYFRRARFAEAEPAVRRSIKGEPTVNAQSGLAMLLLTWKGDAEAALTAVASGPAASRHEHRPVWITALVQLCQHRPEEALKTMDRLADEFIPDNWYTGPKAYWVGLAHAQAGREAAARVAWEAGLTVVDERLRKSPANFELRLARGELLALLGREPEALQEVRTVEQLTGRETSWIFSPMRIHAALGHAVDAIPLIERQLQYSREYRNLGWPLTPALLRVDPRWDKIRNDPRFQKLCEEPAAQKSEVSVPIDQKSVAVLAFANLSDDKANEYFSDGISEELLNVLAKIPGLKVSARTSAFFFKGKDTPIPEIAQKLGVAYVIEGSVRKQGEKVRITAQLIKAADGFHVWSDTFTRDLKDIFAVQDEIAGLIAQQLQLKLGESTRVTKVVNPEAYRLVLEGRQFWNLRSEEGFAKAEAAFTKALAIDPQFAEAHAGLGGVCVIRAVYHELDDVPIQANDLVRAVSEGRRALEIDPASADALAVLAYAQMMGNQLAESDRNFQQALVLNPNSALVHCWYALLLSTQGRLDVALDQYQKAAEADPLWFINLHMMGGALGFAQRYDQALGVLERADALRTATFLPNLSERALALLALGRKEEAFKLAHQILGSPDLRPRWGSDATAIHVLFAGGRRQEAENEGARLLAHYPADSYLRGFVLAALGRFDEALPFLQHTPYTILRQIYWDPKWDPWRQDPRFLQLMVKLGRSEEYKVARSTLARMQQVPEARK